MDTPDINLPTVPSSVLQFHKTVDDGYGVDIQGPTSLRKQMMARHKLLDYWEHHDLLHEGEEVMITERITGDTVRYVYSERKMWCGTLHGWAKMTEGTLWRRVLDQVTSVRRFCMHNPGWILFGKIFGHKPPYYGAKGDEIFFAAMDIQDRPNHWVGFLSAAQMSRDVTPKLRWVPLVYLGPYDEDTVINLLGEPSRWPEANNASQGLVIRPTLERQYEISEKNKGRLILEVAPLAPTTDEAGA